MRFAFSEGCAVLAALEMTGVSRENGGIAEAASPLQQYFLSL